jgi:hypothetical protein
MDSVTGKRPDANCCFTCEHEAMKSLSRFERMTQRRFIVCSDCGNKRCPKATHHDSNCTKSNDAGQRGSVYGDVVLP